MYYACVFLHFRFTTYSIRKRFPDSERIRLTITSDQRKNSLKSRLNLGQLVEPCNLWQPPDDVAQKYCGRFRIHKSDRHGRKQKRYCLTISTPAGALDIRAANDVFGTA